MCNPCSMIVRKQDVLWSKRHDSHTKIRKEFGIPEESDRTGRFIKGVAIEITPSDNDWNAPLDQWVFRVDQDILPEWWDVEDAEKRVRDALPDWVAACIVRRGEKRDCSVGDSLIVASGGCVETCWGDIRGVYGNGTVKGVWGNGTARGVRDNGTVCGVRDNGTVSGVWGNGTVCGVRDNGTVSGVWGNGTVCGVRDNGTVNGVWGNGTVKGVYGNATVISWVKLDPAILLSPNAVLIDRSESPPRVHTGK